MGVATKSSSGVKKPAAKKRVPGIDKGQIWMADDFDVLTERELADWYGSGEPDVSLAEARLKKRLPSLSSRQIRKELGLGR